jgi:ribosomal protein S18 acetylase RimI-like enzyme
MSVVITLHDDVPEVEGRFVDMGLGEANDAAAPLHEVRRLSAFARADDGDVIGGAVGRTWGACCELQQLWVATTHRRHGIAARLVREFERRARERGCSTFYLETFSFQAPGLYRALGYEVAHEIRGFAPDIVKYLMVKNLGVPDA